MKPPLPETPLPPSAAPDFEQETLHGTITDPTTSLWILRVLVTLNGARKLLTKDGFSDEKLAHAIGLRRHVDGTRKFQRAAIRAELEQCLSAAELSAGKTVPTVSAPLLDENVVNSGSFLE